MKARYVSAVSSLLVQLFAVTPMSGVNGQEKDPPNHAASTVPYDLPATAKYDYAEVLHKSLLFYHAQRSGKLGPNRRLAWRGDSCFICSGPNGEDLSGGYYEAANTMKWGLPLAFTVTQLAWNVYAWSDAMAAVNELEEAKEGVKYSWDEKMPGVYALMYSETKDETYKAGVEKFMANFFPGGSVKQTAKGLIYGDSWGSLSYASNIGFIMMVYAKTLGYQEANSTQAITMAAQQINYALGDCGRSWVVGFGEGSPIRPYHKSSYNSFIDYPLRGQDNGKQGDDFLNSNTTNRFILYGALEGGPAWDDTFADNRARYEFTEVTQDYNAAFTGLNAAFIDYYGKSNFKAFSDCGLDLGWSHPNATNPPNWGDNDCYHTCNTNCVANSNTGSNNNGSNSNSSSGSKSNDAVMGRKVVSWGVGALLAGAVAALLA
ncbi:hypothetical protein FRC00_004866 [Tulasnella sp. 408]|nr:hypothetical protein FRC00_004866 [Tulasnella sp. 408]